jgi:hypothetical protein
VLGRGVRSPVVLRRRAQLWSVDDWLCYRLSTGLRGLVTVGIRLKRRDWLRTASTRGAHAAKIGGLRARFLSRRTALWETQWGQLNRSLVAQPLCGQVACGWGCFGVSLPFGNARPCLSFEVSRSFGCG